MVFLLQPALMELYKNVLQSMGEKENKTGPVQIIQDNVKSHREMSMRIFLSAVTLKQSFTILPIKKIPLLSSHRQLDRVWIRSPVTTWQQYAGKSVRAVSGKGQKRPTLFDFSHPLYSRQWVNMNWQWTWDLCVCVSLISGFITNRLAFCST